MNRKTVIWTSILLILFLGIIITGFILNQPYEEKITVGIILPLSGSAAYYGEASQRGMMIAQEEIAKQFPNLKLHIYYEDSAYTPKEGVNAYNKLKTAEEIDAIITAASHVSLAIQPLAAQDNILQMAIFSSAGKYTSPDDLSFRVSTRSELEADALVKFLKEKELADIGILYINNDFGLSFREALKEEIRKQSANIIVVGEESYILEDSDFRTILTKIKAKNPDAIFMVGTAGHYALILRQAKELGIQAIFVSMRSAEDPVLLKTAGELANGLVYTYPFDTTAERKETKAFVNAFKNKYNQVPDAYAAEGYEGFKLVALALNECGKDDGCVKEYLSNTKNYKSVFGPLSFDTNGDVYYNFFYKTVENGKFVSIN